jgi:predicted PurR-regulated permease PerM
MAGITGMMLAVPVYSFIRIVAREFLSEFKVVDRLTRNME